MVWKKTLCICSTRKSRLQSTCTFWNQPLVLHFWASIWIRSLMKKKIMLFHDCEYSFFMEISIRAHWCAFQDSHEDKMHSSLALWCIECITPNTFSVKCTFQATIVALQWCAELMVLRRRSRTAPAAHCLLAGEGQPLKCNSGAPRSINLVHYYHYYYCFFYWCRGTTSATITTVALLSITSSSWQLCLYCYSSKPYQQTTRCEKYIRVAKQYYFLHYILSTPTTTLFTSYWGATGM